MKEYTPKQLAKLRGVCQQRIHAKRKQGHYPHARRCPCGFGWLIPQTDVDADIARLDGISYADNPSCDTDKLADVSQKTHA